MNILMPMGKSYESDEEIRRPVIKVIGLGGGGCNAVNRMIELGIKGVEFIAANTDRQVLREALAPQKIQLGPVLTRGLGAGGNPGVGRAAALESANELRKALEGADMVFLTAGMGGGTGTGSIPVAAEIAKELGAVTIAVVTMPFSFEAGRRQKNARDGLVKLNPHTHTLITISNDRLLQIQGGNMTVDVAFRVADDVLRQAVQGVTELVTEPGIINVDFAHIQRLMKMGGGAFLAIGQGEGEDKAKQAIQNAMKHPLLESVSLEHASGVLVNFTGGKDLTLFEVTQALNMLQEQTNSQLDIIMGVVCDDCIKNRVQVILIVTGVGGKPIEDVIPGMEKMTQTVSAPVHLIGQLEPIETRTIIQSDMFVAPAKMSGEHLNDTQNIPPPIQDLDIPAFLRRRRN